MTQRSPSSRSAPGWYCLDCFHVRVPSYPITEILLGQIQRAAQSFVKLVSLTIFPTETCCHCFNVTAGARDGTGFARTPLALRCGVTRGVAGPAHSGNEWSWQKPINSDILRSSFCSRERWRGKKPWHKTLPFQNRSMRAATHHLPLTYQKHFRYNA